MNALTKAEQDEEERKKKERDEAQKRAAEQEAAMRLKAALKESQQRKSAGSSSDDDNNATTASTKHANVAGTQDNAPDYQSKAGGDGVTSPSSKSLDYLANNASGNYLMTHEADRRRLAEARAAERISAGLTPEQYDNDAHAKYNGYKQDVANANAAHSYQIPDATHINYAKGAKYNADETIYNEDGTVKKAPGSYVVSDNWNNGGASQLWTMKTQNNDSDKYKVKYAKQLKSLLSNSNQTKYVDSDTESMNRLDASMNTTKANVQDLLDAREQAEKAHQAYVTEQNRSNAATLRNERQMAEAGQGTTNLATIAGGMPASQKRTFEDYERKGLSAEQLLTGNVSRDDSKAYNLYQQYLKDIGIKEDWQRQIANADASYANPFETRGQASKAQDPAKYNASSASLENTAKKAQTDALKQYDKQNGKFTDFKTLDEAEKAGYTRDDLRKEFSGTPYAVEPTDNDLLSIANKEAKADYDSNRKKAGDDAYQNVLDRNTYNVSRNYSANYQKDLQNRSAQQYIDKAKNMTTALTNGTVTKEGGVGKAIGEAITQKVGSLTNKDLRKAAGYDVLMMNDEEKNTYLYTVGKYGLDAGNKYLDGLNLKDRRNGVYTNAMEQGSEQHPVLGAGMNLVYNLVNDIVAPAAVAKQITSKNGLKSNDSSFDALRMAGAAQQGVEKGVWNRLTDDRGVFQNNGGLVRINRSNEKARGVSNFLVDTGLSTAHSLAAAMIANGVGGAVAGSAGASDEAAANIASKVGTAVNNALFSGGAMNESLEKSGENGTNKWKALGNAIVNGGIEAYTNGLEYGQLGKMESRGITASLKQTLADLAASAAVEGGQEGMGDLMEDVSDLVFQGKNSEVGQEYMKNLEATKGDVKQAVTKTLAARLKSAGTSTLSGAISGLAFVPLGHIANNAGISKGAEQYFDGDEKQTLDDMKQIGDGLSSDKNDYTNSESYEYARKAKKAINDILDKGTVSHRDKMRVFSALNGIGTAAQFEEQNEGPSQNSKQAQAIRDNTAHAQQSEQAQAQALDRQYFGQSNISSRDMYAAMAKAQNAQDLVSIRRQAENSTDQEAQAQADQAYNLYANRMLSTGNTTRAELQNAESAPTEAQVYQAYKNGQQINGIENASDNLKQAAAAGQQSNALLNRHATADLGDAQINIDRVQGTNGVQDNSTISIDGNTYSIRQFNQDNVTNTGLRRLVNDAASRNSTEMAQTELNAYKETQNMPVGLFTDAAQKLITSGARDSRATGDRFSTAYDSIGTASAWMSKDTAKSLYDAGMRETQTQLMADADRQNQTITFRDPDGGKVIDARTDTSAKVPGMSLYEAVAKATGTTIYLKDDISKQINGAFDRGMMNIVLNTSNKGNLANTIMHEGIGEFTKAFNVEGYTDFQSELLDAYEDAYGADYVANKIRQYQDRYHDVEAGKTTQGAMDELTNDALTGLLESEQGRKDFVDHLQEKYSAGKAESVLQKIGDYFKRVADALHNLIKTGHLSDASQRAAELGEEKLTQLRKSLFDAWDKAIENSKNVELKAGVDNEIAHSLKINGDDYTISDDGDIATSDNGKEIPILTNKTFSSSKVHHNFSDVRKTVHNILNKLKGKTFTIKADGANVRIGSDISNEYTDSKDTKRMNPGLEATKMSASNKIAALIENAENPTWKANKEQKHNFDAGRGWRYYDTNLLVKTNSGYDLLGGILNVRMSNDGNDYVYDITGWKKKGSPTLATTPQRTATILNVAGNPSTSSVAQNHNNATNSQSNSLNMGSADDGMSSLSDDIHSNNGRNNDVLNPSSDNYIGDDVTHADEYKAQTDILSEGMKALADTKLNVSNTAIAGIARDIKEEYGSDVTLKDLTSNLTKVFAYAQSHSGVDYDALMSIIDQVAEPVVSGINTSVGQEDYNDFKSKLRSYDFKLTDSQLSEVNNIYGSYSNFKKMFPEINVTKTAETNLAENWSSIADDFALDPDMKEADQVNALADMVMAMRPRSEQGTTGMSQEEMARDVGMQIVQRYFEAAAKNTADAQAAKRVKAAADKMAAAEKQYRYNIRKNYNDKLVQARKDIAEYYKGRLSKLRKEKNDRMDEKLAELSARNKNRMANASEQRKIRYEQENIRKRYTTLATWLQKPTDEHHVPSMFRKAVTNFLHAIDIYQPTIHKLANGKYSVSLWTGNYKKDKHGNIVPEFKAQEFDTRAEASAAYNEYAQRGEAFTQKAAQIRNLMSDITKMYQDAQSGKETDADMKNIDEMLDTELTDSLAEITGNQNQKLSIGALDSKQLHTLSQVMRNLIHAINNANRMQSMNADLDEIGNGIIDHASTVNGRKEHTSFINGMSDFMELENATPSTYFHGLGDAGDKLFKSFENAKSIKDNDIREITNFMYGEEPAKHGKFEKGVLAGWTTKELANITGEKAEIHTFDQFRSKTGQPLQMTTGQIMGLYELQKREQAMLHTVGGIAPETLEERIAKKNGKTTLFKRQHRQAQTFLTKENIDQITDTLTDRQKQLADSLQHYMATHGSEMGNEVTEKWFGYSKFMDPNYYPITTDSDTHAVTEKNQATGLINAIKNMGFTKQTVPNASNPLIIRDIFDVFADHMSDMSTYHAYAMAMNDLIRVTNYSRANENTPDGFTDSDSVQKAISKIYGDKGKQYVVRFLADLGQREKSDYVAPPVINAFVGNYKSAAVWGNIRVVMQQPTAYVRASYLIPNKYLMKALVTPSKDAATMQDNTSAATWSKKQGNVDGFIYRDMKSIITGQESAMDKAKNIGMDLAGKADDVTWRRLYKAVYFEQKDKFEKAGKETSGQDFTDSVNSRFDDLIALTQVTDGTIYRSQLMRRNDKLNQMQSSFMAEPTKSYNLFLRSLIDIQQKGWMGKENKQIRTNFFRASGAVIAADLAAAIAQSIADVNRNRDKDDEKDKNDLQMFFDAMFGKAFLDGNVWGQIDLLQKVPIIKDGVTALENLLIAQLTGETPYSNSDRMDTAAINNIVQAVQNTWKYAHASGSKTLYGVISSDIKVAGQLLGVQPYNLMRDIVPIYNRFNPDHKLVTSNSSSSEYSGMYTAIQNGNKITEEIQNKIDKGAVVYDLQNRIKSKFKEQYYNAYQTQGESGPFKKLEQNLIQAEEATGMTNAEATNEVQSWREKNTALSAIEDAIENGTDIKEVTNEMLDEAEVPGKKANTIQKHIIDHYGSTLRYYKDHDMYGEDVYDDLKSNIKEALQAAGSTDPDTTIKYMEAGDTQKAEDSRTLTPELQKTIDEAKEKNSQYYDVYKAVDSGKDISGAVSKFKDKLMADGKTDKDKAKSKIGSAITSQYKEKFLEKAMSSNSADRKDAADLKNRMLQAYRAAGYSWQDKNEAMNKWLSDARKKK